LAAPLRDPGKATSIGSLPLRIYNLLTAALLALDVTFPQIVV
jgi:hypothetical protein